MGKRINTAKWYPKQKRWQIKVQRDGKRLTFYSSTPGRNGQREANAKADKWLNTGILPIDEKTKTSIAYNHFMNEIKLRGGREHYLQYEKFGRLYINPALGNKPISKLTDNMFQNIINYGFEQKNLSKKYLSNIKGCMTAFMKFCRKEQLTTLRLENLFIPKKATSKQKKILQPSDLKILFSDLKIVDINGIPKYFYIYAFCFQVINGLRPGELIGLKKTDIKDNIIHLSRSINRLNEITKGKNKNAVRDIRLNPLSDKILISQYKMLEKLNINSEYIFPNEFGEATDTRRYYRNWRAYKKDRKISDCTPYELRHTFVSIVKSLPEGFLKKIVGHSKDMDTFGVYGHEVDGELEYIADRVYDIFSAII